jgi:DNA-directed RNA polymerase sigma subunit (sigma70/sigma32)
MSYNRSAVSFDAPLEANTEKSIAESLHDHEYEEPILSLEREAALTELELGLKMLSPIEFEIVIRRFGFMGYNPMTLQEVAHDTGFTSERVRQIQLRAIKFLSQQFKDQ